MELTFLRTCKFVNARLTRWILSIQDYNITMEHCPGRENIAADLVSRQYPGKQWEKERDIIQLTIDALRYKCSIQLRNDLETLQQLQKEEIRINKMIKTIEKKEDVHRFELYEGILYRKTAEESSTYQKKTLRTLIWEC